MASASANCKNKKKYGTYYNSSYTDEFKCIISSKLSPSYVFCTVCCTDFSIFNRGRGDIEKHISRDKHQNALQIAKKNKKIDFSSKKDELSVIRAESLFTAFLVEHNLPISAADHAGPLFRKMFPDSEIAKKYGCARTKTTAIINEMASSNKIAVIDRMKKSPFSISIDGSNKGDKKLYPIVITCRKSDETEIENALLSVPVLEKDATGENIANLILEALKEAQIPFENCLALGVDNAPVMIGKNAGVGSYLLKEMPHLFIQGCLCHLINLAAEKSAACLDVKVEEYLIDIYYYLDKSVKRKEKLKKIQVMFDVDVRKILKHVSTRWLSLGRCLERLVQQWEPLTSFFKEEVKNGFNGISRSDLSEFKIPKIKSAKSSVSNVYQSSASSILKKSKSSDAINADKSSDVPVPNVDQPSVSSKFQKKSSPSIRKSSPSIRKSSTSMSVKKNKRSANSASLLVTKRRKMSEKKGKTEPSEKKILSREERLFLFLTSDINRAYVHFLLNTLPIFEDSNTALQANHPKIHILMDLLLDVFKSLLSRFVIPAVVKESASLLDVDYHAKKNQKPDSDIVIGQAASQIVSSLPEKKRALFFENVRQYYVKACDYARLKFPFKDDVIINAGVANLDKLTEVSFSSVKYFIGRFPVLQKTLGYTDENKLIDALQSQFCSLQFEEIPVCAKSEERMDAKWISLCNYFKDKYDLLTKFMISILTLPHSNAECERIFSYVTKTHTQFRSQLSCQTLESLLTVKSSMVESCFEQNFDNSFLKRAKSATTQSNCS